MNPRPPANDGAAGTAPDSGGKPPTAGTGGTVAPPATGTGGTGGTTAPPAAGKGGTGGTTAPPTAGRSGTTSPPTAGTGGTTSPPTGGTTSPPTGGTGGTTSPPTTGTGGMTSTPTPVATTLRLAAIGDYGHDNSDATDVADLVTGWNPNHVFTLGDNNYESGSASTIDANIGKRYHAFIGNYQGSYGAGSATNRFWPSPGNHDWVATNLKPYTDYFTLPGNERYYDVDLGLVHLYAIDSDSHEPDGNEADSKQALWLKEKLAASTACFDLVYFHHPPYSSGDHGSDTGMRWPFEAWGAEAVLAGHDHHYERFQVGAIPYFVNGLGGAGSYPIGSALPESRFRYNSEKGAMLITATATGITFEFWSHDGQKVDSLLVPKACGTIGR